MRAGVGLRSVAAAALLGATLVAGGCASVNSPSDSGGVYAALGQVDPLERYNRAIFGFNEALDRTVVRPIAHAYEAVIPEVGRVMVTNFFSNIGDLWVSANNLLQGKPREAASDLGRFAVNTTLGFFGVADVATELGLEKHYEDLGLTLGRHGFLPGPYLVLPLFGPSNLRDGFGFVVESVVDPVHTWENTGKRNNATALRIIDTRVQYLASDNVIEGAALDRYLFVRDSYLQRRRYLVHEGASPYGE